MIYHVKSEQVRLNERIACTTFVLAVRLLGCSLFSILFCTNDSTEIRTCRESFDTLIEQVDALAHARI